MEQYSNTVTDSNGAAISGALVYVYDDQTTTLSTIYSDNGVTTQTNPITTDANGAFSFYAADATYDLTVTATNYTQKSLDNITLGSSHTVTGNQTITGDLTVNGSEVIDTNLDIGNGGNSFTIAGTALTGKAALHADSASDVLGFIIERHDDTAAFGAHFVGARTRGTESAETAVQSGDLLTRLLGLGYDGTDYGTAAEIKIEVDGTPGAGDMPGRIVFEVTPDGSETMAEAMRISNDKSVDFQGAISGATTGIIGSTSVSPDGTLHVFTASAGAVTANANADDLIVEGTTTSGLSLLVGDTGTSYIAFGSPTSNFHSYFDAGYNSGTSYVRLIAGGTQRFKAIGNGLTVGPINTGPDGTLHVLTASAGTVTAGAAADDLVVENSTNGGMSILVPDANQGNIYFGNPTSNTSAYIKWDRASNLFSLGSYKTGSSTSIISGLGVTAAKADANQNVQIGTAAIATTATDGFLYIPSCAGAPTGTPSSKTGLTPMVYDSTNNHFYIYNGGWKSVALA